MRESERDTRERGGTWTYVERVKTLLRICIVPSNRFRSSPRRFYERLEEIELAKSAIGVFLLPSDKIARLTSDNLTTENTSTCSRLYISSEVSVRMRGSGTRSSCAHLP